MYAPIGMIIKFVIHNKMLTMLLNDDYSLNVIIQGIDFVREEKTNLY